MKAIAKIIAIISLLISLTWEIAKPDYEPLLCVLGSIASIIALWGTDEKSVPIQQINKDNSTGYQASKITIKNPKK